MEKSGRGRNTGRLPLPAAQPFVPSLKNEGSFDMARAGAKDMELQSSVHRTMEFLSRTWSPSSARFFTELSSIIQDQQLDEDNIKDEIQIFKEHGVETNRMQCSGNSVTTKNTIWISAERMKAFISEKIITRFVRGTQTKRKEKIRFQMAQVHAALSVARLASSIAGTLANCSIEPADISKKGMIGEVGSWDKKMSLVIASAATLVAAVCADVAESVGAQRAQINSIISRSLAPTSASDIRDMTAAAATSLRGAKALEVRKAAARHGVEDQVTLMRGVQLKVCNCGGKCRVRVVSVYIKRGMLMLRLGKRLMKGAICTYKEYRITDKSEDKKGEGFAGDGHTLCSISLATTEGAVQLYFEDKRQYMQWSYTISNLFSTGLQ